MMWLLAPPKPNESIEIRRRPSEGQAVQEVGTFRLSALALPILAWVRSLYLQVVKFGVDLRVQFLE